MQIFGSEKIGTSDLGFDVFLMNQDGTYLIPGDIEIISDLEVFLIEPTEQISSRKTKVSGTSKLTILVDLQA